MAKLTLEVESNAFEVFNKSLEGMDKLRAGAKEFEKEGKSSFETVNKQAQEYTNQIKASATETVLAANKTVDGKSKEKAAIALLKDQIADVLAYEKKIKEIRDNTAPGKQQAEYQKKLAEVRLDLKGMEKDLKNLEDAEKSLTPPVASLKTQLRELKAQLGNTTDPEEFARLAVAAGEVEDKINDASQATRAFAADSKISTAKTLFSQIGNDLINLDFKSAADKARQFSSVMKTITFKETFDGIKSLGSALTSIGKTLITNPFFLLVAAIVAVGIAIKGMIDSVHAGEQALKDNADALKGVTAATEDLIKANRDLALENDITSKKIAKSDGQRLQNQNKFKDAYLDILKQQREAVEKFNADIDKERDDDGFKATKKLYEFFGGETTITKRQKEGLKQIEQAFGKEMEEIKNKFQLEDKKLKIENQLETEKKAKESAEKLKALQKELQASLADLAKRSDQALLKGLSGEALLLKQKEINEADLATLRKLIFEKGQLINKNFKLTTEQEELFSNIKTRINQEYFDGLLKLEQENALKIAESRKKEVDSELAFVNLKAKIAEERVKAKATPQGLNKDQEAAFELLKQKHLLEIKKSFLAETLKLKQDQVDAELHIDKTNLESELSQLQTKNDAVSIARVSAIAKELKAIEDSAILSKELLTAETQTTVNEINKELDKIGKDLKPRKINLAKLLGADTDEITFALNAKVGVKVKPEEVESAKSALDQLSDSLKSILNDYFEAAQAALDQELDMNDERIAAREKNIDDLKDRLEEEKELRDQGLANNVDRLKAEIAEQEAARQVDLANEQRIKKEKMKLAKQQLIIDTVTQGSQMVLAIAQLYAALSSFTIGPIPVGVIIATATSAAMLGAFISGKKKVFDAVNSGQGLRKGGFTGHGNPDEPSGHFTHKEEFVQTAEDTKEYRTLFEGIHTKNKDRIVIGIKDLLRNTGVVLTSDLSKNLSEKKQSARDAEVKMSFVTDNSGVEDRMDSVESHVKTLVKQGSERQYIDANGNTVIIKGSATRIIKKR